MHALRLRIILRSGDRELLEKRFRIVGRIHNIIVKYAMKQLRILRRNKEYRSLLKEYHSLKDDENRRKSIAKQLNEIIAEHRLTKGDIEKYASLQGGKYKNHLSSQQVQKEADRVYCGISKVLYSGGKRLHYKKLSDTTTICGKSASNGGKLYDAYHDYLPKSHDRSRLHDGFLWCGRYFWLDIDYSDPDIAGALNGGVSYCEVKRLFFDDGWHYYLNIYLKGEAPRRHAVGSGTMGIDYGTSTLTAVSEDKAMLRELAPNAGAYEKNIYKLQRKVDRSKRKLNPDNYNPDGTAKKGRRRWALSKNCRRYLNRIKALHRKKAAYVRQCHEEMANDSRGVDVHSRADGLRAPGKEGEGDKALGQGGCSKAEGRRRKESLQVQKKEEVRALHKRQGPRRAGQHIDSKMQAVRAGVLRGGPLEVQGEPIRPLRGRIQKVRTRRQGENNRRA